MKRKITALLMGIMMSASVLAGCAAPTASTAGTTGTTTAAATTAAGKTETKAAATTAASKTETKAAPVAVDKKVVNGTVTYNVDMTKYEAGKKVRLWLPVAQSIDLQKVEDVKYEATGGKASMEKDAEGNQMLYVEWDENADPATRKVTCSFVVSRDEAIRPELKESGTIGDDLKEYLKPSVMVVTDGSVKALADEITKDKTTVLEKTRAIYDWIIANMHRDDSVLGCGTGDVETLLVTKGGKCTDINSVFVGLCRSVGIPAREMFGVRMNAENITKNQHCWAQFYLPGTGWVYADPADVLKALLKNNWTKDSKETKDLQEYFWGSMDAERVELSRGRDLVLAPAQAAEPLNNFGYPHAEVDGEVIDCWAAADFVYTISFAKK